MNMKSRVIPVGSESIIIVISHPQKPETTIKLLFWVGVLIAVMPLLVLYDVVMFMGLFSTEFNFNQKAKHRRTQAYLVAY